VPFVAGLVDVGHEISVLPDRVSNNAHEFPLLPRKNEQLL